MANRLDEISSVESTISSLTLKRNDHQANIRLHKSSLVSLKNDLDKAEKEVYSVDESKIDDLKKTLNDLTSKQKDPSEVKEVLSIVGAMLKDGGIKTRIIKQYVPIMNKLINRYLAAMDFFVDFQLDENFNEKILSRFRDEFSYASFSEGEKAKIDIALLLTWRAIASIRISIS